MAANSIPNKQTPKRSSRPRLLFALIGLSTFCYSLVTCSPQQSLATQLNNTRELRVVTINSPTTYYSDASGRVGFEYDLVARFAEENGYKLTLSVVDSQQQALARVASGSAHIAAASIFVTPKTSNRVVFGPPIRSVQMQLVYANGSKKPKNIADLEELEESRILINKNSPVLALEPTLRRQNNVVTTADVEPEDILVQIANREVDYGFAPSDLVSITKRYYPEIRVGFNLKQPVSVAWALPKGAPEFAEQVTQFFEELGDVELARLRDRYFGHIEKVDYIGASTLAKHVETRLPKYRAMFEGAAKKYGLDWRLLAAVGYQESHWDPHAVSPTGVKGIMQITLATAKSLGVSDRTDPQQAIYGAARYLYSLDGRLSPDITDPDRQWMMLASYNIGLGHVFDARALTKQNGGDPNRWVDVRKNLPLLAQPKVYKKLRRGYARGHEAVTYVGNIRTYYDILTWMTGDVMESREQNAAEAPVDLPAAEKDKLDPLTLDLPIL